MLQLTDFQIAAQLPHHLKPFVSGNYSYRLKQLTIDALKAGDGAVAYVAVRFDGKIYALAASGFIDGHYSVEETICDPSLLNKLEEEDFIASQHDLIQVKKAYSQLMRGVKLTYFANCILPLENMESKLFINVIDWVSDSPYRTNNLKVLQALARAAAQDIGSGVVETPVGQSIVQNFAIGTRFPVGGQLHEFVSTPSEPGGVAEVREDGAVVGDFLLRTLIEKPQLRMRNGIHYSALATWKKSVREVQIRALFALKKNLPDDFVSKVAEQFAASVERSIGRKLFKYVVAVPCGNSGPDCLSHKLAKRIAARFGAEFAVGFERFPRLGTSHPKNNPRLGPPKTIREFDGPVLLIDDVATSGSHIELSTKALRKVAPAVFPIVWICD